MGSEARIIREVLEEHPLLMKKLEKIYLLVLVAIKEETAEDRFEILKSIVDAYARYYALIVEMKAHETKEEKFLLPMLKEEELRRKMEEEHRRMEKILEVRKNGPRRL